MTDRKTSKLNFIGLHAHSGFSVYDGLGMPAEHMNFAHYNGMDALALTDHGHMNGFAYQLLHSKEMKKKGKSFKPIFGNEMYFIESFKDWTKIYQEDKLNAKNKVDDEIGLVAENEQETKSLTKSQINKRSHLVVLAQNQEGLTNLFHLTSKSYNKENFYRFPRVDFELLREHNKGLIISNACLGGTLAKAYWENREKGESFVLDEMRRIIQRFGDIFDDRFYGEIQFNSAPEQHDVNQYILQLSREMGFKVIATADSHYPNPDLWKSRELYKRLNPKFVKSEEKLPGSVDEIGYELYPKNGDEMFEAFKKYSQLCGEEYNSKEIISAIEETHRIAFERIEDFSPDSSIKLPSFIIPPGEDPDEILRKKAFEGLKRLGLDKNPDYVSRLENEIDVVSSQKFSKYFLTMEKIIEIAKEDQLIGPARGCFVGDTKVKTSSGPKPIQDLSKEDVVFDKEGKEQKVLGVMNYDVEEEIIKLDFLDGTSVECTKDHKFLSGDKMVKAEDL